ncbi:hypothetical protein P4U65_05175 [Bacillus pacificus]|nr:hypothetical protein [Bacillus thuringiensis]MED1299949.1 hypothetical protein [Bacillus pacificus]
MLLHTEGLEKKINKQGKTVYFVDDTGGRYLTIKSRREVTEVKVEKLSILSKRT